MSDRPTDIPAHRERFTILHLHASGGLGQVSLARDEKLNRQVALKEIRPDKRENPGLRQRFLTEAEITGQLEHPGIVPIYDLDQDAHGEVRYAMRFVQGRTLRDAIRAYHRQPSPLGFRGLLQRFVSVCETIAYAHSQGVIHRDLKPANVLLGDYGETLVVDWGLAKRLSAPSGTRAAPMPPRIDSDQAAVETIDFVTTPGDSVGLTMAGHVLGTPAYMAPEQAAGQIDLVRDSADVYGLGAMLYEILTDRPPYQSSPDVDILENVRAGQFERPSLVRNDVPKPLEAVCLKAMAREITDRYATAAELAREVERWLADEPLSAYQESPWGRFARWRRRHRTQVVSLAVLLLTAFVVGGVSILLSQRARDASLALGKVETLREATPASVSLVLASLDVTRDDVRKKLLDLWEASDVRTSQRQRVGLALLPVAAEVVRDGLVDLMLAADEPQEFLLLRDGLAPYIRGSTGSLWKDALDPSGDAERRFRLLVALAAFDSASEHWPNVADGLAKQLVGANSLHLGTWSQALEPVHAAIVPPLRALANENRATDQGRIAMTILTQYVADQPELFVELLLGSSAPQFTVLWPGLRADASTLDRLKQELNRSVARDATDATKDDLASRQANAALALCKLGTTDPVWPLLAANPEPRLRSYLIHRFAAMDVDVSLLLDRLVGEQDPSIRQALLLSLGEYAPERLGTVPRGKALQVARDTFEADPMPGVHSAAEWLLQRLADADVLANARRALIPTPYSPDRRWYVTSSGQTMAVLPGPTSFTMVVSHQGPNGSKKEVVNSLTIPYSLAVATRKITRDQIRRYVRDDPSANYTFEQPEEQDAEQPATQVTWIQAARYCRWLSEQERIPEEQMCFPAIAEIQPGLELPSDYTQRTGYRLPTNEEWECVARAGTTTPLAFGSDLEMLKFYGWHIDNSAGRTHAVGLLKPNDLGLFDVHGLAYEWCSDQIFFSPGVEERIFRGSPWFHTQDLAAISLPGITANRPTYLGNENGMRIVRTVR